MSDSRRTNFNISNVLGKCREYFALQHKATYWFGAILSLLEEVDSKELIDDLDIPDKV